MNKCVGSRGYSPVVTWAKREGTEIQMSKDVELWTKRGRNRQMDKQVIRRQRKELVEGNPDSGVRFYGVSAF